MFSLISAIILLLTLSSLFLDTACGQIQQQQRQQQTNQGAPIAIIPGITGNILTIISFLIGTSSFILGLRIQSAARTTTAGPSSSSSALPSSIIYKYFDSLILALVIPSIAINVYGILVVGSHLYSEDSPYLVLLFALFIPVGAILFLVRKLRVVNK